ncbi:MAG: carbohydrate ABC transporter permease [Chloroflexi bacterium]|nr:carbohydrate ABC transporter permease [Chloroflexota bacterium]
MASISASLQIGKRAGSNLSRAFGLLLLLPGIAWVLMPTTWMFSAAFSTLQQVMQFPPDLVPKPWVWTNFSEGFTFLPFGRYYQNSLFIAVSRVLLQVIAASITGYAFARLRAPGREFIFVVVLSTMMLPYTVTMIPQFVLFKNLGWINTYYPLIIPHLGGSAFLIFLFRQFFRSIPEEIFEAARLDGCHYFDIYVRILMPLSMPVIATAAILVFQNSWQDLIGPLIYINSTRLYTLPLGLATFRSSFGASPWNLIMAVSMLVALPPITLFFAGQKYMISGIVVTEK